MNAHKKTRSNTMIWKSLVVTLTISLVTYSSVLAAAGDLDTSFSGDGKVITNIGGTLLNDRAFGVVIQSDGKIIVAGDQYNSVGNNYNFVVVRYNTNGVLDATFSGDGKQTTDFGGLDQVKDVAIQSNGKIVVLGQSFNSSVGEFDVVLARYNSNGSLDTTFSGDGKVTTDYDGADNGSLGGIAIQSNGKIVVAGYMKNSGNYDFATHRYNSNGTLDTTFSGDGRVNFGFGTGRKNFSNDLVIQPDGKIVIVGNTCDASYADCNFAVARLNTNGTLDTTFSGDGKQITNFGGNESGNTVALQSDGKIVVAGKKATASGGDIAIARYNTNGNLDTTFSGDGKQITNLVVGVDDWASDLAIQSDGKIIVIGGTGFYPSRDFVVVRYKTNGVLDTTFSGDGKVISDFGNDDFASAVVLQANGRIVVAGQFYDGTDFDFAVARYLP